MRIDNSDHYYVWKNTKKFQKFKNTLYLGQSNRN